MSINKISAAKSHLIELENTDNYVFHGSPVGNIEVMEPRQAKNTIDFDDSTETIVDDGDPAVSATPYLDIALFRSIANHTNIPFAHSTGFDKNENGLEFTVSDQKTFDTIHDNKVGFIYVFNKSDFTPYSRSGPAHPEMMEWRSEKPVKPVEVIQITSDDLPERSRIQVLNQ